MKALEIVLCVAFGLLLAVGVIVAVATPSPDLTAKNVPGLVVTAEPTGQHAVLQGDNILNVFNGPLYVNGAPATCYDSTTGALLMATKPPSHFDPNEKPRKPEHDDIRRARQDVTDRSNEYTRATVVFQVAVDKFNAATQETVGELGAELERAGTAKTVSERKLIEAQKKLERELEKPRRA